MGVINMDRYERGAEIGEGAYGKVYRATHKETGQVVALKKIGVKDHEEGISITTLREIKLLRELNHEHIIELSDVFAYKQNIYLAMPLMQTDLEKIIKDESIMLTPGHIKAFLKALLESIKYLHDRRILHRDIKPSNLLVSRGAIKLIDFGFSRCVQSSETQLESNVVTLWYRAPELLFGSSYYGTAVDLWSVGCVFAELLRRQPFLPGESELDQMAEIFRARGTPTTSNWPGVDLLPNYLNFSPSTAPPLQSIFTAADPDAINLLQSLLELNPVKRITAEQALQHAYFRADPPPTPLEEIPVGKVE